MRDANGIIDARSASPLAPDLAAAISDEGGSEVTCCYHTPRIYRVAIRRVAITLLASLELSFFAITSGT